MDEITLENFRCFRERQTARLAPLTLLVGENSTGKTSFMAMIRALWDIGYRERVPDFKEEPYDLGSFDEIAHHRGARGGRAEEFNAGFGATPATRQSLGFAVTFHRRGTAPIPVKWWLAGQGVSIVVSQEKDQAWLRFDTPRGSWKFASSSIFSNLVSAEGNRTLGPFLATTLFRDHLQGDLKDLVLSLDSGPPTNEDFEFLYRLAGRQFSFRNHEERPYASAPVRSRPRRTYDPTRPARDPEGDYVPMYLASNYFQNKKTWAALKERLERRSLR